VYCARYQLLASSTLASNQNVRPARGSLTHHLENIDHPRIAAYERIERIIRRILPTTRNDTPDAPVLENPADEIAKRLESDWLYYKIDRALAHRRYNRPHVIIRRHQHDVGLRRTLSQQPQQLHAIGSRHSYVGDHEIRNSLCNSKQRFRSISRDAYLGSRLDECIRDRSADCRVIIDNQNSTSVGNRGS
jgi:hypothetical protein